MPHRRPVRRSAAFAVAALAIATPLLSSCGFNYATDRVYTPAAGLNDRDGEVDILSAVIVASRPGEGTLVASISNGSPEDRISLQGVEPTGSVKAEVASFPAIPLAPLRNADLAEDRIGVTGDFGAGQVLNMTFTFSNGQSTTMGVTVVTNCDEFAGFDTAFADAPASSTPSASPTEVPSAEPSESATEGKAYDCSFPGPSPMPHSESVDE